jgi:hypothetical protein
MLARQSSGLHASIIFDDEKASLIDFGRKIASAL